MQLFYRQESYEIIGACFELHKHLGSGFPEAVYQEAAEIEFIDREIPYEREVLLPIYYKEIKLDKKFKADYLVYNSIILEFKAVKSITEEHFVQIYNYTRSKSQIRYYYKFRITLPHL